MGQECDSHCAKAVSVVWITHLKLFIFTKIGNKMLICFVYTDLSSVGADLWIERGLTDQTEVIHVVTGAIAGNVWPAIHTVAIVVAHLLILTTQVCWPCPRTCLGDIVHVFWCIVARVKATDHKRPAIYCHTMHASTEIMCWNVSIMVHNVSKVSYSSNADILTLYRQVSEKKKLN